MKFVKNLGEHLMFLALLFPVWSMGVFLDTNGDINSIGKSIVASLILGFFGVFFRLMSE